jgi:hypothetical protein
MNASGLLRAPSRFQRTQPCKSITATSRCSRSKHAKLTRRSSGKDRSSSIFSCSLTSAEETSASAAPLPVHSFGSSTASECAVRCVAAIGRVLSATTSEIDRRWQRRECAPRRAVAESSDSTALIVARAVPACKRYAAQGDAQSRMQLAPSAF